MVGPAISARSASVPLTDGSVVALLRLRGGDQLERKVNRSVVRWISDNESLHHLTFKNLSVNRAIKKVKGRAGFEKFVITDRGRRLAKG